MQMSGIFIADDARSWFESGMVRDVTIRNNNFIECGAPVILIAPENKCNDGYVHRNITITNNLFPSKKHSSKLIGTGGSILEATIC